MTGKDDQSVSQMPPVCEHFCTEGHIIPVSVDLSAGHSGTTYYGWCPGPAAAKGGP